MREARCHCGQLQLRVTGEPSRVTICNCDACKRRTGSAFGTQARFSDDQVEVTGRYSDYSRTSEEPDRAEHVFHFCPDCGSSVFNTNPSHPGEVVVAVGAFADPSFPPPQQSHYDAKRPPWVGLPDSVQRFDWTLWQEAGALYRDGRYSEAADKGREAVAAHPDQPFLHYNIACCESLAGRPAEALSALRLAIEGSGNYRAMATEDSDFDPIRDDPGFQELTGA